MLKTERIRRQAAHEVARNKMNRVTEQNRKLFLALASILANALPIASMLSLDKFPFILAVALFLLGIACAVLGIRLALPVMRRDKMENKETAWAQLGFIASAGSFGFHIFLFFVLVFVYSICQIPF